MDLQHQLESGLRFLREIKLAAGLTHTHILPVYDSVSRSSESGCVR